MPESTSSIGYVPRALLAASAILLLAGCAGGTTVFNGMGMNAPYEPSNAIMPTGFSETAIDPTHYEVKASGTETSTRERVEKIALARAAQIGVDQRLKYFKVANVTHGVACSKAMKASYKVGDIPATARPTVVLDVYYAKQPAPDFRSSADTFTQVKAELDADATPPDARTAASAQVRAECGAS